MAGWFILSTMLRAAGFHMKRAVQLMGIADSSFRDLIAENLPASVIVYDAYGRCLNANDFAFKARGYGHDEFDALSVSNLYPPEYEASALSQLDCVMEKGACTFESVHRNRDGTLVPVKIKAQLGTLDGKRVIVSCVHDQERMEPESHLPFMPGQTLQTVLDSTPYCIMLVDKSKTIRYVNDAALALFGYESKRQVVGCICHDIVCPSEKGHCPVWDHGIKLDKSERKAVTKGGLLVPILKSAMPIRSNGDEMLLEAFVDISKLKEAEEFIRGILESVDEGFIVIDRDFKIVSANKAYVNQSHLSHEQIINSHCYEVSHGADRPCYLLGEDCAVRHTFETGKPHSTLHIHGDHGGTPLYVETKAYPLKDTQGRVVSAIEIINDITEKRKLEEQLRQSQKMEAVGTLAGGIAHDFNNILTTILGYSEFITDEVDKDSRLRHYIDMVTSSATKASKLTQSLLAFSRKQVIYPEPININEIIEKMHSMIARLIGEDIEVKCRVSEETLVVSADGVQIEQIIMNLANNARDAMPEGGTLVITCEPINVDEQYVETHGFGKPGRYVLITVSDSGTGMDRDTVEHIFEPFFTTKAVGKGTGLGLSVVYGIIKQHNGFINVYSEPGVGTTFKIMLPLSSSAIKAKAEKEDEGTGKGSETVLLAEDDEAVRTLVKKTLERAGYSVIEASDGEEAIRKLRENVGCIDMMLLDIIMPKRNGVEVYTEGMKIKPTLKAMMLSGYPSDIIDKKNIPEGNLRLIMKPVSPTDLLKRIREVLEG